MAFDYRFRRSGQTPSGGGGSEGLVQSGPPPADDTEDKGPAPLGVPRGYRVPSNVPMVPGHGTQYTNPFTRGDLTVRGPRYFDGDQWQPASTSPTSITQIQKAMATAGLLKDFRLGVWDRDTAEAYTRVLEFANASGVTDQQALQQMVQSPEIAMGGSGQGGGSGRQVIGFDENGDPIYSEYVAPPLEMRTTSKTDLKTLFRSLTSEKLGVGWTDAQLNELVDAYNWQEIRVQADNYNRQTAAERTVFNEGPQAVAGQVIASEEAPSPEAFAQEQLIARDPTGYQAAQVGLNSVGMFEDALSKWGNR